MRWRSLRDLNTFHFTAQISRNSKPVQKNLIAAVIVENARQKGVQATLRQKNFSMDSGAQVDDVLGQGNSLFPENLLTVLRNYHFEHFGRRRGCQQPTSRRYYGRDVLCDSRSGIFRMYMLTFRTIDRKCRPCTRLFIPRRTGSTRNHGPQNG